MVRSSREQQMSSEGAGQLPALLLVKDSLPFSSPRDREGEQDLRLAKQPTMHRLVLLPLLAGVIFCCLGVFLSLCILPLAGSGFEGAYALGTANEAHGDQGANNVYAPLPEENYPFTPAVEVEKADNSPVNAGLLTMLFLVASFIGATAGWLLTNAQGQGALCFSLGVVGEVLGRAREPSLPFLGVFRL
jgi:hypothetical protein